MSWTTRIDDLRALLSDGATDKLRHRKRVIGDQDNANLIFKTFEFRRITDFTAASPPPGTGVFVNGASAACTADVPEVGEFTLNTAPTNGDRLEATYYVQWFTDTELTRFFQNAVQWLNLGDDPDTIPNVLRPAALQYAAADAYQKFAVKWTEYISETYRMEDAADEKNKALLAEYRNMETTHRKEARQLRNDYYSRAGANLEPKTGAVSGRVSGVVPRR